MSLTKKIILSIVVLSLMVAIAQVIYISNVSKENTIEQSVFQAKQTIKNYKQLRAYYAKNVVGKVKKSSNMKIAINHEEMNNAIPLPATMIHNLSNIMSKDQDSAQLRLYSAYPFPNRASRVLDDFAKESIDKFRSDKSAIMVRQEVVNGTQSVRVAIADLMVAPGCVACHNTHPQTPKNDWKMGDVRGVLEVIMPIEKPLATNENMVRSNIIFLIIAVLILVIMIILIVRRAVVNPVEETLKIVSSLAEGKADLKTRLYVQGNDEISILSKKFNMFLDKLQQQMSQIKSSTYNISSVTKDIEQSSMELDNDAKKQLEDLNTINSSIKNMHHSMESLNTKIEETRNKATQVKAVSNEGSVGIASTIEGMNSIDTTVSQAHEQISMLEERSNEISDVVGVIDDIAEQTNLLALNAAIEAARAGEHGRGFAVVADEVRKLAEKTVHATSDVGTKIKSIQNDVRDAVQTINFVQKDSQEGTKRAENARESIDKIDSLMDEVDIAAEEIVQTSKEQTIQTDFISNEAKSTSEISKKSSKYAYTMNQKSEQLKNEVDELEELLKDINI